MKHASKDYLDKITTDNSRVTTDSSDSLHPIKGLEGGAQHKDWPPPQGQT